MQISLHFTFISDTNLVNLLIWREVNENSVYFKIVSELFHILWTLLTKRTLKFFHMPHSSCSLLSYEHSLSLILSQNLNNSKTKSAMFGVFVKKLAGNGGSNSISLWPTIGWGGATSAKTLKSDQNRLIGQPNLH